MLETAGRITQIAWRNVLRRRRVYRYVFLTVALFNLFFVAIAGVGDSFAANLEARALVYYGGHQTLFTTTKRDGAITVRALPRETVDAALAGLEAGASPRHVFRKAGTEFVHEGASLRARMLVGVDWKAEARIVEAMDFAATPLALDEGSILISRAAAERLGAERGTRITVSLQTMSGQRNTAKLVVAGILHDDPVFGAGVAYLSLRTLNEAVAAEPDFGTEYAVWMPQRGGAAGSEALRQALAGHTPLWEPLATKKRFLAGYPRAEWEGDRTQVFSLTDHTRELGQAIAGLRAVLGIVAILLLAVVVLGLTSTLRVILYQRTREIGTVRALGMQVGSVVWYLSAEMLIVAATGSAAGSLGGYALLGLLSSLDLSSLALLQSLLRGGRLAYVFKPWPALLSMAAVCLASGYAGLRYVWPAAELNPADALASSTR